MPDREALRPVLFHREFEMKRSFPFGAAVDASIHQDLNLVPQLIVTLKSASLLDSEAQGQYMAGLK